LPRFARDNLLDLVQLSSNRHYFSENCPHIFDVHIKVPSVGYPNRLKEHGF